MSCDLNSSFWFAWSNESSRTQFKTTRYQILKKNRFYNLDDLLGEIRQITHTEHAHITSTQWHSPGNYYAQKLAFTSAKKMLVMAVVLLLRAKLAVERDKKARRYEPVQREEEFVFVVVVQSKILCYPCVCLREKRN